MVSRFRKFINEILSHEITVHLFLIAGLFYTVWIINLLRIKMGIYFTLNIPAWGVDPVSMWCPSSVHGVSMSSRTVV
jgi:hypothetical protein